jgi:NAD(P)-dependent dehydrogenase (short-subunit alcohol dehydrogenase family)
MPRLAGKVCLVTGTGGSIGRATALTFAREGAAVVGCDIGVEAAEETVALVHGTPRRAARGETRFPPMAPLGGLFATQRCHWVDSERGRCARYAFNARFGRSADATHGTVPASLFVGFIYWVSFGHA